MEDGLIPALVNKDQEALVPVYLAHSFLERSALTAGLPHFGFIVGREAQVENLGAFGRSLLRSLTLHDALGKIRSQFSLYSSAERLWWIHTGPSVNFFHRHTHKTGPGSRYAQQCALLLMRDLVRLAAGPTWQPTEVFSTDSSDASVIEEVFEGAVVRRSESAGFVFPAHLLSLPIAEFRRGAAADGERDATAFEASAPAGDFVGSIRQVISALMRYGRCQLDEVADAVGMHPRTLQRCGSRRTFPTGRDRLTRRAPPDSANWQLRAAVDIPIPNPLSDAGSRHIMWRKTMKSLSIHVLIVSAAAYFC